MSDKNILDIGKFVFGSSFLLGNICLLGYIITKNGNFAEGGFMLITYGSLLNFLVVVWLLIYGIIYRLKLNVCLRSIGMIIINIPIAILYTIIGSNLLF